MAVAIGQKAPDFQLYDTDKKLRSLGDFAGKNIVLAFYPGAFTGTCTKEMCTFRDSLATFNSLHADVIGISVDGVFANKEFAAKNGLQFPILSDFNRTAIKAFGIEHHDFAGLSGYTASRRAVFVLDKQHIVRFAWISENPGLEPNYDEIKNAIAAL
jgi:glutaredoxin-dependent peroxiredoxin